MAGPASTKWMRLTLLGVLLQAVGLCFFVMGFFPVKPALKGNSGIESLNFDCSLEHDVGLEGISYSFLIVGLHIFLTQEKLEVKPQFDRVVLMVIDGLPAEFLLGRDGRPPSAEIAAAMPFTQGLIFSRRAMGFHARAAPPTVTMPRLKAMTSGAIAGFLDVAFNFNTQALLDDNLIGERQGWNLTLYGDDTWLRLFPKSFARKDGVSSFFVKDTIQVDQNVSRHLHEELARKDWDLLILHYLGLDHVGHLGGRSSSLMADKLQEMDNVIKQLHASLLEDGTHVLDRETLLVIASDHGMTHGGNHGGASYEETDALALFICKRIFSNPNIGKAFQVDLVPTLAMLLGVPIPKNSVGVLLPQLFDTLPAGERLRVLEVNAWQISKLLRVRYPKAPCISSICSGKRLWTKTILAGRSQSFAICSALPRVCMKAGEILHAIGQTRVEVPLLDLLLQERLPLRKNGSCNSADWEVVSKAYLLFLHAASDWLARGTTEKNAILIYSGGCLIFLSTVFFLAISLLVNREMCNASKTEGFWRFKPENWITFVGVIGHALSFNSSSLVEEEQFTLHFVLVTMWCLFLRGTYQKRSSCQASECPSYRLLCNLLPSSRRYLSHGDTGVL
ncbi:hypothetical protein L7F22_013594 [Adiantum nelumboides]|nr:hypothetical protein [Adiantum nelumboides]